MEETRSAYKSVFEEITPDCAAACAPEESLAKKKFVKQTAAAIILVAGIFGFSVINPEFKLKVSGAIKTNIAFAELKEKTAEYVSAIKSIKNPFAAKSGALEKTGEISPSETSRNAPPEEIDNQENAADRVDFEALDLLNQGAEY
jgi:hypothetical protein